MLNKSFLFAVTFATVSIPLAQPSLGQDAKADKAREFVRQLGTGPDAKVEIKLRNDTKIKGHIASVATDSLTVIDRETGASRVLTFDEIDSIRKPRSGLKPRTWAIIAGAAVAAIIVGKTVLYPVLCDGGAGC